MGTSYQYRCNKCGFEHRYLTGGGFFTEEYFNETKKLETELRAEAASGKYGQIIKAMLDSDKDNNLCFSCETKLFQCLKCCALIVHREKNIGLEWHSNRQFELNVDIIQTCPQCGSSDFKNLRNYRPICPKCKEDYLELVSLGKSD